jgi:hypothetical protein
MKYLESFEHFTNIGESWQWIGGKGSGHDPERTYKSKLNDLLVWAYGPGWKEDWKELETLPLFINGDQIEEDGELLGYHESLKRTADTKIEISAEQEEDWGISVRWYLGDDEYEIVTQDWPFESNDVTDEEANIVRKISSLPSAQGLDTPIIIDFVQWAIREKGVQPHQISDNMLYQWISQQRISLN